MYRKVISFFGLFVCLILATVLCNGESSFKRSRPGTNLMAFPRVGRGRNVQWPAEESMEMVQKKGSNPQNMNNGMWFGPRLGRVEKRKYNHDVPWAYFYFSGDYTPRLGRESEEVPDEQEDGERFQQEESA